MPKFLDTISYFDESGNENFIECGRQRIEISNTSHSINMATIAPGKYIFRVSSDCVSSGKLNLNFGSNTLSYSWSSIPYQLNYVAFDVYCYEEEMPVSKYFVFYNISIKPGSTNVVSNLLLSGTFAPEIGRKCSLISSVINASLLGTTNIISNDIGIGVNGSFSTPTLNRSIFAPTSGGTAGQILTSNGFATPTWSDKFKKLININSALNTVSPVTLKAASSTDVLKHFLFLGIKSSGATAASLLFPIGYATSTLQNARFSIIMPLSSGAASSLYISSWNALFCPMSTNYSGLEIVNIWGGVFTFSSNPSWTPGAPAGLYFDAIYSL